MRALALSLVTVLGAACVDLEKPRAYRCDNDQDCRGSWACLRDHYCHDRGVGAAVECDSNAECTGGWFCGQERKCLDPSKAAAFPCSEDRQCAAGWRCSSERHCVELSTEPRALDLPPPSDPPTLRSPLVSSAKADLLRTSSLQAWSDEGGLSLRCEAALTHGSVLEVSILRGSEAPIGFGFGTQRYSRTLTGPAFELAISHGVVLAQLDAGLRLIQGEFAAELAVSPFPGPVQRLVPLGWVESDGGREGGFVAIGVNGEAALVNLAGGVAALSPGVIDVAIAGTASSGGPALIVLRQVDGGEGLFFGPGLTQPLLDLPRPGAPGYLGQATRLRAESSTVALVFEQFGYALAATVLCDGGPCDPASRPIGWCPTTAATGVGTSRVDDFGLPAPDTLRLSCSDEGYDFLYDFRPGNEQGIFAARPALTSWGTSGGHVRQAFGGQLAWSGALDDELTDVLDARPEVLGLHRGSLLAVKGRDVYWQDLGGAGPDAGLALGLRLIERVSPSVTAKPVAFMEEEDLALLESGAAARGEDDGGLSFRFVLPVAPAEDAIARRVEGPDGGVFVVTTGGGLFAGADDPDDVTLLSQTLRPAPGFSIGEWALRQADGGFLEGWAVANNRLFRVTASSLARWKSVEFPVTGRDPLAVWFSGEAAQLGTASGEVLSLPSRLPVVPPLLDGVTSIAGLCGAIFATTSETVWEVVAAEGGMGAWQEVDFSARTPGLYRPVLHRTDSHLFVVDEDGVVLELSVCP